jgi:hypothetical protein
MAEPQHEAKLLATLAADLFVGCDVGRVKDVKVREIAGCKNRAAVAARIHCCRHPEGDVVLICATCLATLQTHFARAIRHAVETDDAVICPEHGCHRVFTTPEDFVYATEALL